MYVQADSSSPPSKPSLSKPKPTEETLATDPSEQTSGVTTVTQGSFFGWLLFLLIVIGVPVSVFVWMGGMRLVRRKFGKGERRPDTERDGYMRVDLEK